MKDTIKCEKWFSCHDWSQWETIENGNILRDEDVVGKYIIQQRKCKECGRIELNKVNS